MTDAKKGQDVVIKNITPQTVMEQGTGKLVTGDPTAKIVPVDEAKADEKKDAKVETREVVYEQPARKKDMVPNSVLYPSEHPGDDSHTFVHQGGPHVVATSAEVEESKRNRATMEASDPRMQGLESYKRISEGKVVLDGLGVPQVKSGESDALKKEQVEAAKKHQAVLDEKGDKITGRKAADKK